MPVLLHERARDTLVVFPRPVGRVTSYWIATALVAAVLAIPPLVTGFTPFWTMQIVAGCVAVFAIAGTIQWFAISRTRIDLARGRITLADGSTIELSRVRALGLHGAMHRVVASSEVETPEPNHIRVTRLSLHVTSASDDQMIELAIDSDHVRAAAVGHELARRLGVPLVDPTGTALPAVQLPVARVVSGGD